MKPIKLLSLNVSLFDSNNDTLKQFLSHQQSDILCLQEVTRKIDENTNNNLISIDSISEGTPFLPYSFFAPLWAMRDFRMENFHGKTLFEADFNGFLEMGNYMKSKFKIIEGHNIFLQNHFTYADNWGYLAEKKGESRAIQIADISISDSQQIRILNYHGIWSKNKIGNEQTKKACETILHHATQTTYPVIICGDFNLFPDTESMKVFDSQFINLANSFQIKTTRPKTNELSNHKRNVVDYILVSKDIHIDTFEVINSDVSDHFPLTLTFRIN